MVVVLRGFTEGLPRNKGCPDGKTFPKAYKQKISA